MKPTVSLGQCFIVFLQTLPLAAESTIANPIDRLKNFTSELSIPSLNLIFPLAQFGSVETALKDVLNNRERNGLDRLVIAGGRLEGEVTILSMTGLALGFDVCVLGDLLDSSDDNYNNLYWNRLVQAGVVPTTMIQMIAEWLASETEELKRANIQRVLEKLGLTGKN